MLAYCRHLHLALCLAQALCVLSATCVCVASQHWRWPSYDGMIGCDAACQKANCPAQGSHSLHSHRVSHEACTPIPKTSSVHKFESASEAMLCRSKSWSPPRHNCSKTCSVRRRMVLRPPAGVHPRRSLSPADNGDVTLLDSRWRPRGQRCEVLCLKPYQK